jgi:hypothetical protein
MPRTPDASMVTTFRRVNATVNSDPTKKSRTFVAPTKDGFLSATLRSTQEGQSMIRSQSVLGQPVWVSLAFKGRIFLP